MFDSTTRTLVVVGAQWGDEGKGKLVDVLAERADWVVRYQGGANAGHTVHIGDRSFVLHQIPSGMLHEGVRCAIGNGVVLDPDTLFEEIDELVRDGIDVEGRLYVSDRAHLVLPYHKLVDASSVASREIGTTGRGIGPAYEDKVARRGVRVLDLRHPERLRSLAADAAEMHTDPTKVKQILLNLLSNAAKFTHEGEVALDVRAEEERVAFEVRDTGIGIREQDLASIWEDFRQVDQSRPREDGGTGLGLSITRKLVERLGGEIEVRSSYGEGSTFTVWLPRESAESVVEAFRRDALTPATRPS